MLWGQVRPRPARGQGRVRARLAGGSRERAQPPLRPAPLPWAPEGARESERGPWSAAAQVLTDSTVAGVLLAVHSRLRQAGHPRHALGVLPALRALMSLLGDRACAPATFRYVLAILLRMLGVRSARGC